MMSQQPQPADRGGRRRRCHARPRAQPTPAAGGVPLPHSWLAPEATGAGPGATAGQAHSVGAAAGQQQHQAAGCGTRGGVVGCSCTPINNSAQQLQWRFAITSANDACSPGARSSPLPSRSLVLPSAALQQQHQLVSCSHAAHHEQHQHHHRARRWPQPAFASLSASAQTLLTGTLLAGNQQQQAEQKQQQQQHANKGGIPEQLVARDLQQLAQDIFEPGDVLAGGRYRLLDKVPPAWGLADGRFTTVWCARDTATGRDVVIKCVEAGDSGSYLAGTREAALHAAAGRHPNLVPLLDAFEHRSRVGRHAVLVTEPAGTNLQLVLEQYVGAVNLGQQQQQQHQEGEEGAEPLLYEGICRSPRTLRHIARQTLAALDHLHKRGLVHMDLALDNLVIDKEFRPVFQIHRDTLFPRGDWRKGLQSWWRLMASKGAAASAAISDELEAALRASPFRHEGNLHKATIRLTDFGRAVPFAQLQQQQQQDAAAAAGAASSSGSASLVAGGAALQHNEDGLIVFGDPSWRPPEEVLALEYARPPYDMWRLGCLMYSLATAQPLFDTSALRALRDRAEEGEGAAARLAGCGDDELLLYTMSQVLGPLPRELASRSPLYTELFIDVPPTTSSSSSSSSSSRRRWLRWPWLWRRTAAAADGAPLRISRMLQDTNPDGHSLAAMLQQHTALTAAEVEGFAGFLRPLLAFDPDARPSAADALRHPWLAASASDDDEDHGGSGGVAAALGGGQKQQQQQRKGKQRK